MEDFDVFTANPTPTPTQPPTDLTSQQDDMFGFAGDSSSNTAATLPSTSDDQQIDSSWAIENDFGTKSVSQSDNIPDRSFDDLSVPAPSTTSFNDDMFESQNDLTNTSDREASPTANNSLFNDSAQEQSDASFDLYSEPPVDRRMSLTKAFDSNVSPVQAFNIRHQQEIAEKTLQEREKIDQLKQQARNELKRWYDERTIQLENKRQTIKNEEDILRVKAQEKSNKETCDWAKVVRFLEFSGTTLTKSKRDVTRMKACILNAKRSLDAAQRVNGV